MFLCVNSVCNLKVFLEASFRPFLKCVHTNFSIGFLFPHLDHRYLNRPAFLYLSQNLGE
jgi:hypothetical protein